MSDSPDDTILTLELPASLAAKLEDLRGRFGDELVADLLHQAMVTTEGKLALRGVLIRSPSYEADFCAWANSQAETLRRLQPAELDWPNLVEELEGMARSEARAVKSQLERLLIHLLKWRYEPARRGPSWEVTIINARAEIDDLLKRSPSLQSQLDELFGTAYQRARGEAGAEMGWSKRQWELLPDKCEWPLEQVRDPDFWPA
jgi:Domain of unknown function DUF29